MYIPTVSLRDREAMSKRLHEFAPDMFVSWKYVRMCRMREWEGSHVVVEVSAGVSWRSVRYVSASHCVR